MVSRVSREASAERHPKIVSAILGALCVLAITATPASAAPPEPFGHACTSQNGVRFCPTADPSARVPTFDGIPLDADVTLPATGHGPFPTIVMLHGYGGDKTDFEADTAAGNGSNTFHYNNVYYAKHGYAVVTYTARGFGGSCGGGPTGDHTGACGPGYIHLADTRFEARDTQFLLGQLVDEGITDAGAIGVTGISYGGGQSTELAFLNNKIRRSDGSLSPWRSPDGVPLHISAAYPRWPWTDLVDSLIPNGRYLDTKVAPEYQSIHPIGVPIQSYVAGLYALGKTSGYYCGDAVASTPCLDRDANINLDYAEVTAGQPLNPDALEAVTRIYDFSTPYALRFVKGAPTPAPLLIENGWTDDLFPPEQALRVYNYLRSRDPRAPVSLQFGDLGHSRGSNKPELNAYLNDQAARFFKAHLKHEGSGPAPGSVTAFTMTCPADVPDGGPFKASSWRAIHHRAVRFGGAPTQTITSAGGDPNVAAAFDPIAGTSDACKQVATEEEPNTASYTHVFKHAKTMLGLPTVKATIATTGNFGQIDARLFDLTEDGKERLITRGVYSLKNDQTGKIRFQLHGNGWRFAKGDTAELQLLGKDSPYYQASNGAFSVDISDLTVRLPRLARHR
jgi:fermentation-respiration switch protein FrsA (DUF1100 family)